MLQHLFDTEHLTLFDHRHALVRRFADRRHGIAVLEGDEVHTHSC